MRKKFYSSAPIGKPFLQKQYVQRRGGHTETCKKKRCGAKSRENIGMNFAAKNLRNAAIATVVALGVVAVDAVAGGFVKNSEVGGYRVIVEGGGVEKRKEIQYDSQGREIYNSEGFNPKLLTGGGLDNSLLGDDNIDG
ncbi:MAG: hypothetical protein LUD52_05035, partial [Opitutae bacterium]|nr:hypothetical protein [Opitutae bacterium]